MLGSIVNTGKEDSYLNNHLTNHDGICREAPGFAESANYKLAKMLAAFLVTPALELSVLNVHILFYPWYV